MFYESGKYIILTLSEPFIIERFMNEIIEIASLADNRDFKDTVRKALKNNAEADKDLEKKVRKIVADSVKVLFRGLWERNNFWTGLINNQ